MRTNIAEHQPAPRTHEGAVASRINSVQQLRRSVMATMLWEDGFYEDGTAIADRIKDEVKAILAVPGGAEIVANIAYEARTTMKLRHVPLHILVAMITAKTEETRKIIAGAILSIVQRPDELGELVSLYWKANGKRVMLPHQVKIGLAAALSKFDEYQLAKWNSSASAVKLRDVMFLVHAKPKDALKMSRAVRKKISEGLKPGSVPPELSAGEQTYWKIANDILETPDTWETNLSAGADKKETFERLISEGNLGAMALLRNLRGMQEAGVDELKIRAALLSMKTERVLPFRFITAARYAPQFEAELEAAMFRCIENHEKLLGRTALVIDNSGSMYGAKVSGKSELTRADAAQALAMLLREVCERVHIIVYSTNAIAVPPRRGFGLADVIMKATDHGSTNTQTALYEAEIAGYDRIIVITDEQSRQSITEPRSGTPGYFINVANDKNGIGYGAWKHIDGWSEAIVDWIIRMEYPTAVETAGKG